MIKYLVIFAVILCGSVSAFDTKTLWECNYCRQQYIGTNPPRFVKCPASDNKNTHWWIQKR